MVLLDAQKPEHLVRPSFATSLRPPKVPIVCPSFFIGLGKKKKKKKVLSWDQGLTELLSHIT